MTVIMQDPVCGMTVDPDGDIRYVHASTPYGFCSAGCRAKFREDPEGYLGRRESDAPQALDAAEGTPFVCPMDPEVRQIGPGSCPKEKLWRLPTRRLVALPLAE